MLPYCSKYPEEGGAENEYLSELENEPGIQLQTLPSSARCPHGWRSGNVRWTWSNLKRLLKDLIQTQHGQDWIPSLPCPPYCLVLPSASSSQPLRCLGQNAWCPPCLLSFPSCPTQSASQFCQLPLQTQSVWPLLTGSTTVTLLKATIIYLTEL